MLSLNKYCNIFHITMLLILCIHFETIQAHTLAVEQMINNQVDTSNSSQQVLKDHHLNLQSNTSYNLNTMSTATSEHENSAFEFNQDMQNPFGTKGYLQQWNDISAQVDIEEQRKKLLKLQVDIKELKEKLKISNNEVFNPDKLTPIIQAMVDSAIQKALQRNAEQTVKHEQSDKQGEISLPKVLAIKGKQADKLICNLRLGNGLVAQATVGQIIGRVKIVEITRHKVIAQFNGQKVELKFE